MSGAHVSPLFGLLDAAGGVSTEYHGGRLVRHFGDPRREYEAATTGVAVVDRSHRTRLRVSGRSPAQMLNGVLTGAMPKVPDSVEPGVLGGTATYHAVLTPKGKMITDLVAHLPGSEEEVGFLLDVPMAGRDGLLAHFGKFIPPRFASVEDVSERCASISVVGPEAPGLLSRVALGLRVDPEWLSGSLEGEWRSVGSDGNGLVVIRAGDVWPLNWTVHGSTDAVAALWRALVETGAVPAGLGVWKTLGVEAGRPVFGTDMDETTLPPEAGIVDRAIDQTKGCYTGQEVIVRIRDRGHVNRQLRRLVFKDGPAPVPGTELLAVDSDKVVGTITSAVQSPRLGGVATLAYVRRGVERVRLGDEEVTVPDSFPTPEIPPTT